MFEVFHRMCGDNEEEGVRPLPRRLGNSLIFVLYVSFTLPRSEFHLAFWGVGG